MILIVRGHINRQSAMCDVFEMTEVKAPGSWELWPAVSRQSAGGLILVPYAEEIAGYRS